jgi:hypothetical protein
MRGEGEITLGEKTYKLKASAEALIAIEDRLGMDLLSILMSVSKIKIPYKAVCVMFHEFHNATIANQEDQLSFKKCCQILLDAGYMRHSAPILNILGEAVMAGKDDVIVPEGGSPS